MAHFDFSPDPNMSQSSGPEEPSLTPDSTLDFYGSQETPATDAGTAEGGMTLQEVVRQAQALGVDGFTSRDQANRMIEPGEIIATAEWVQSNLNVNSRPVYAVGPNGAIINTEAEPDRQLEYAPAQVRYAGGGASLAPPEAGTGRRRKNCGHIHGKWQGSFERGAISPPGEVPRVAPGADDEFRGGARSTQQFRTWASRPGPRKPGTPDVPEFREVENVLEAQGKSLPETAIPDAKDSYGNKLTSLTDELLAEVDESLKRGPDPEHLEPRVEPSTIPASSTLPDSPAQMPTKPGPDPSPPKPPPKAPDFRPIGNRTQRALIMNEIRARYAAVGRTPTPGEPAVTE